MGWSSDPPSSQCRLNEWMTTTTRNKQRSFSHCLSEKNSELHKRLIWMTQCDMCEGGEACDAIRSHTWLSLHFAPLVPALLGSPAVLEASVLSSSSTLHPALPFSLLRFPPRSRTEGVRGRGEEGQNRSWAWEGMMMLSHFSMSFSKFPSSRQMQHMLLC